MVATNAPIPPADQRIVLNGVDYETGGYLTPPVTPEELLGLARDDRDKTSREEQEYVKALDQKKSQPNLGFDANLEDLSEARWGVVFAEDEDDSVKQAVESLIQHRADQLGFQPPVLEYTPDITYVDFLAKNDVAAGIGEVEKVPYYLLIIGSPDKIPFRFQYELGSEYAVGRLDFLDAGGYRTYIEQLIDYETSQQVPTKKEAVFWGTANEEDSATALSSSLLVQPLHDGLDAKPGFAKQLFLGQEATKANLAATLARQQPPSLLFTASHGLGFRTADARQRKLQGALVTQEWEKDTPITPQAMFCSSDLGQTSNVRGLVHFAFACYGAGTPKQDDYSHGQSAVAPIIADFPFVADLPRTELSRGALAFIGHIERAWGYSFINAEDKPMIKGFERAVRRLLKGTPVGHALRDQHDRAVQLSHALLEDLNDMDFGKTLAPLVIAEKWKERNDARAYAVIGDPAARLRVEAM